MLWRICLSLSAVSVLQHILGFCSQSRLQRLVFLEMSLQFSGHPHTLNKPWTKIKKTTKYLHVKNWNKTRKKKPNSDRCGKVLGRKCREVHTPLTPDWLASQYIGPSQNSARFPISITEIHIVESDKYTRKHLKNTLSKKREDIFNSGCLKEVVFPAFVDFV